MNLTLEQKSLHQKAIGRAIEHKKSEWALLEILQQIEAAGLAKQTGCSSLFEYAVRYLDLDPSAAYPMIKAARLAREIPQLAQSFIEQRLTVAKAVRIFSTLNAGNAKDLVKFAETHSANEINREVTKIRESLGLPAKTKSFKLSDETIVKAKRLRSVLKAQDLDQAIHRALDESLDRHDPVRKAQRAMKRGAVAIGPNKSEPNKFKSPWTNSVRTEKKLPIRKPLTAHEKHQVFARDGGCCTHIDTEGRRCTNDRYLHIHHIKSVSHGGTNDPVNLTTLCSFHHDLAHQLSLPVERQITWLRDPKMLYGF